MRTFFAVLLGISASAGLAPAGPLGFGQGIGPALVYGPYTGGHRYSYNVAYSYGLAFNSADTWRIDPVAYPAGVMPFRPFGRPILWQTFPRNPRNPPIAVLDELGLPILRTPGIAGEAELLPVPHTTLKPVDPPLPGCAKIRIQAPEGAEVFVEKEKLTGAVFLTPPLQGRMQVYSVRAKWLREGREVEQFRVVGVQAGETAHLIFGD